MITKEILGLISVAIMVISNLFYLTSIFKGRTKLHVFSWLTWGIIAAIAFLAQVSDNAGPGSWTMGFITFTCFMYSILALFKGEKNIKKSDWLCFITALITIPLWYFTKTPFWSVILISIINALGYIPTFRKSFSNPYEEAILPWSLSISGVIISMIALDKLSVITLLYPLTSVIISVGLVSMMVWRRAILKKKNIA